MPTIEINSQSAISRPTPVRVAIPADAPAGPIALSPTNGGTTVPAQRDGDALVAILPAIAAGSTSYELVAADSEAEGVALTADGDNLKITLPEGEFSTYRFGSDVARPHLWPLHGPGQRSMTRHYPMEEIEGETRDHIHHKSLWTAYGEVNGTDNWGEEAGHGYTRHKSFEKQESGPVFGGFTAHGVWTSSDETPLLDEVRSVRVYNAGAEQRLFDYDIKLTASYSDIEFGDTKEAGFISLRVATTMDGTRGGTIENSNGGRGEEDCWGKPAAWCDYSGNVEGETLGMAILNHPDNTGGEPRWHIRAYGLIGTNPLATGSFTGEEPKAVTLKQGESLNYRYRVYLHHGDAKHSDVAAVYLGYIAPPA